MNIDKKIIVGIVSIAEGLNSIAEALKEMNTTVTAVAELCPEPDTEVSLSDATETPVEELKNTPSNSEYTEEELSGMSYNDIKKLAKELGIPAVGNRKELVKKILSADTAVEEDSEENAEEKTEEKTEVKPVKSAPKTFKKTKVEEPEPVEEDEEDEEEEDEDPVEAKVKEVTEGMSDDEIREVLEDVGISTKGKRQSLISKLVKAVNDGLIDLDEDDEEAGDSEDIDVEESDITEDMTKPRKKAYEELCDETSEAFESGEITREDLIEFINAFNGTDDKFKKVSDEDLLTKYLELSAMLIDDEGNIVEEGAYTINDEPYCCGHPLHYDEDGEKFICECCGSEYEADE